jgi:hypothetical protein
MELANIEKLIEKYLEASTTLAEEQQLREYFAQEEVAPHLAEYQALFSYFSVAKQEQFTKQVPLKTTYKYMKWVSVAAVLVFAVGIYMQSVSQEQFTKDEIRSAQKALAMLSTNFNKGTTQVQHLNKFTNGASQIGLLGEFEEQTNKFLHNDKK